MNPPRPCYILVGPEDRARLREIEDGLAPRLDYRLVTQSLNATIVECSPPPTALQGGKIARGLRSLVRNFRAAVQLVRRIPNGSLIYSTGETWGLPASLALRLLGKSCVHVVYAHRVYSPAWGGLLRRLRGAMRVDGWICVTNFQSSLLRQALGLGAPPVITVSQGVDTQFYDPAKADPPPGRPYVLSLGAEMRDYAMLFEAVRDLPAEVIVKASSAWMTTGRHKLASVPANVRVITERLSYVELRDLYAGAALVVAPLFETPQAAGITTILEGMAMGKCILATKSSGLPDVLIDKSTGLVVPSSAVELRRTIEALYDSPVQCALLGAAGQQAVRSRYTLEHHTEEVAAFLNEVSGPRPSSCPHNP